MKGETKAKRRATLSICGLGFLDETEIETIPRHEQFEARNYEVNESTPAKCDKCSKDIVDIKNPEPSKGKFATLSAAQAIAYSEKTYDASWCWDCIIAEKRAKVDENGQNGSTTAPIANKTNEVSRSTTPSDDVTPDPLFTEFDGKLLVSGTVTEIKPGASFALFMGKERFSTFSASTAEILKDSLGKRVILEYKTNEKGGKTYKNIFDVRNIGGVDYDNGVPCTDVNADLYVTEEDTKEPF
jgi:hypothetical protein